MLHFGRACHPHKTIDCLSSTYSQILCAAIRELKPGKIHCYWQNVRQEKYKKMTGALECSNLTGVRNVGVHTSPPSAGPPAVKEPCSSSKLERSSAMRGRLQKNLLFRNVQFAYPLCCRQA